MTDEIIKTDNTPASLIAQAIDKGLTVEALEKLMQLQERWEANQARKAFFVALADFQNKCPELRKNKKVGFDLKTGGRTDYNYAPLSDIDRQIKKVMEECGLSKRWEILDDKDSIKVTCLITHNDGHTERTSMTGNPDTSGSKNPIQARGSAIEYMKRYTLIGALGITTADNDIDGRFPEQDIDKLHKDFMDVYNQVIQLDASQTKYHPDNWKVEASPKVYVKAVGELRKVLFELQNKKK